MVEKLISKAKLTRNNWWEAFRAAGNVKGDAYYEIPEMLKFRYPAPGSCALERVDHPNLYKVHWKTPFRSSPYNIRQTEKPYTTEENTDHFISSMPTLDPSKSEHERVMALQMQPDLSDLKLAKESAFDSEEGL